MQIHTVSLLGATGLIGQQLLQLLSQDSRYQHIRVLSRRPIAFTHPKVAVIVLDFEDEQAVRAALAGSQQIFCSVGTTQARVKGDLKAYRKVDYDIPARAARLGSELGCQHFSLVTSVGADPGSKNFYLQLKGAVEDAVQQQGIPSVAIFRPSMLLGKRQEFRPAERLGQLLMQPLAFLFPAAYKPVTGRDVARAMIAFSQKQLPGAHIYQYTEMQAAITAG
jgi:uncharacterized protein YbjT (DUF2867 family)